MKRSNMELVIKTSNDFDKLINSGSLCVVDLFATWCGPCRMLAPTIEAIAEKANGKYSVAKVDVDEVEEIAIRYGVNTIPTLLYIKDGPVLCIFYRRHVIHDIKAGKIIVAQHLFAHAHILYGQHAVNKGRYIVEHGQEQNYLQIATRSKAGKNTAQEVSCGGIKPYKGIIYYQQAGRSKQSLRKLEFTQFATAQQHYALVQQMFKSKHLHHLGKKQFILNLSK